MEYRDIRYQLEAPSALVRIDRPERLNAFRGRTIEELIHAFHRAWTARDVACVVLTGAGDRAFCVGGDQKEYVEKGGYGTSENGLWELEELQQLIRSIPKPVIAAVNGAAFGGGCEFAMAADFIYAAKRARFALTEVSLGIMPGAMGTQNMPRAVGVRRAKEIILTAAPFTAEQALEWGLVNKVCENGSLLDETLETAERIAGNAPISTRQAKRSISIGVEIDLKSGYAFEIEAYNRLVSTEDRMEGIRAFNEKRRPRFKGR